MPQTNFFGMLKRRERWGFTWKGWLLVCLSAAATILSLFHQVHPFLAANGPIDAEIVVIEGWLSTSAAKRTADLLRTASYTKVFITGGPIDGTGEFDPEIGSYAEQGLDRLLGRGVPKTLMCVVPSRKRERDRTYSEAIALRNWFQEHDQHPHAFNLLSEGVHSRRSRLLFQKAFGPEVQIGIIALPPSDYPADHWWKYSAGVREVISEAVAYVYARFFFWP